ncbi:GTPase [Petrotoga mexicana DSM 14811]|uniref:GTPase n=1 Tax=Petrotoga mexicana DSM 14811 TaxID=1122954 RepID=A0A2K1PEW2_9BACT|nr:AAA family ATPase [Petrotoga mexicana]PNS01207.1 GTPase [Petrotoga mexicana DSM 14811]
MDKAYEWVPFYEALADKLLEYNDKRSELFELMKNLASHQPLMKYFHFEREELWGPRNHRIDPFSVVGVLNRKITNENRIKLAKVFANTFRVTLPVPTNFNGIPTLNNIKSFFGDEIDELWDLFVSAIKSAEVNTFTDEFKSAFEKAIASKGNGLASITIGLFWIRPNVFMPLDTHSRKFISEYYGITVPKENCSGDDYVEFLNTLKNKINEDSPNLTFPELSYNAWSEESKNPQAELTESITYNQRTMQGEATSKDGIWAKNKNIILYGPPGTGKTYSTIQYAVAIIEDKPLSEVKSEDYQEVFKRYLKYKDAGLIAFVTFHQSFSYEEFIEGIRPVVSSDENGESTGGIEYVIQDGVFKLFCNKAGTPIRADDTSFDLGIGKNPTVWKVTLKGAGDNQIRTECMENGHIRIGWDGYGEITSDATDYTQYDDNPILNAFYNKMQIGDIVMSCYSSRTIDAIGVITGEPEWHDEYSEYKRLRKVKWLVKGINEDIVDFNAGKILNGLSVAKLSVSATDAVQILRKVNPKLFDQNVKIPNRVFIIDEINRGNISKIFGELITLIEPSKRIGAFEELRATLPYSRQDFGVPDNVFIIGTMNTADRSIAMIDTALRRRFEFVEMKPDTDILKGVRVKNIDISNMLDIINKRIIVLLDREHTIGHSYLLPLKTDPTIETLAAIFKKRIIPLLQEYFYDDYEKIQLVLGDNQKTDDTPRFIVKKRADNKLFGNTDVDFPEYYVINSEAFSGIEAYEFLH